MAVRNAYVLSEALKAQVNGAQVIAIAGTFETLVADDILSKYRLCKVGADWIPIEIELNNDSIGGFTDANLGLYDTLENGGAVKDYDCFMDGTDISAGYAIGSEINCLSALPLAEIGYQMYQHAGDSTPTPDGMYDLVLTADSEITGAGTVSFRMLFAKGA